MPSLSTKERKAKWHVAIKEFNDELLNIVKIQDKMEKTYSINEQVEIDKLWEIWEFDESIKNLETLLAKSSGEYSREEIELIKATKEKKVD